MSPLNITQPLDSIRYMVYNGYYKVMSNIPKMGHLTTPVLGSQKVCGFPTCWDVNSLSAGARGKLAGHLETVTPKL